MFGNLTLLGRHILAEYGRDWSGAAKKAKVAVFGNRSLTDEVLFTTMCLVEQTFNAHPITSASDDPGALEALTPHHLILGRANVCIPFIPNADVYTNHRQMF